MSDTPDDEGGSRRRVMLSLEPIKGPADAIELLDVYLQGERDWHTALARQSVFRLPSFKENYDGLTEALVSADDNGFPDEGEVDDKFRREAIDVAAKLINNRKQGTKPWSDASFGRNQLENAMQGKPMRFDKAVIAVLAFNRFARRFGLLNQFAIVNHSVVVSGFFFSNLHRLIESYAGYSGQDPEAFGRAVAEIAALSGQTEDVVAAIAGSRAANLQTETKEKAVTHLGTFPTLVAILQILAPKVKEAGDALEEACRPPAAPAATIGNPKRPVFPKFEKLIVRRRAKMSPPQTMNDELIVPYGRVTWGPYGWPEEPGVEDPEWPPLPEPAKG